MLEMATGAKSSQNLVAARVRSEVVHPQNAQDSAGLGSIAAHGPLEMRNRAAPPVLHRFRGKQIQTNAEFQRSNESLFPKKTLNRFHNPSVVWILPVVGRGYFLQKNAPLSQSVFPIHLGPPRVSN
jgi:hypothetical protein